MAKPSYTVDGWKWQKRNGYERPEFWPGYNESIRERDGLEIHIVHGASPEHLLKIRAPNAKKEEWEYMTSTFRQVTLSTFSDYENTLLRAMNDNNFSMVVGTGSEEDKERAEEFRTYINTGIPEFGSVLSYVRSITTRTKALDAMGLVVILPGSMPVIDLPDGQKVIDPDTQLEPAPQYIEVDRVWGFEYDKWYLYLTYENSWVQRGKDRTKTGLVFNLVDDTWVWKIMQTGQAGDFQFEIVPWWEHGVGGEIPTPPCTHLMGTPISKKGFTRWQSHYLPAKEHLDQALWDTSYLNASKAKLMFPKEIMLDTPCAYLDPITNAMCGGRGILEWYVGEGEEKVMKQSTCPACRGTGGVPNGGPMGTILIRSDNTNVGAPVPNVSEAYTIVSPPVESSQFLRDEIDYNITKGREILHLHSEKPIVGGEQATATQVGVDVRASQAFIKPIADQTFFIIEFIMDCIGWERYGASYPGVTITRPSSYDIRTEQDLRDEYEFAVKWMPPSVAGDALWSYIKFTKGHEPDALVMYNTIKAADDVFANTPSAIAAMQASQLLQPWQVFLHQTALNIYESLSRQGKLRFTGDFNADVEVNKAAMIAMAKEMTPTPVQPALDRLQQTIAR